MHPQFYEAAMVSALASALAAYCWLRPERARFHTLVVALMLALMTWSGGVALSHAAVSPAFSPVVAAARFGGLLAIPPLWVLLAAHLGGFRSRFASVRGSAFLALPSLIAAVVLLTQDHHGWLPRSEPGELRQWAGPFYWAWVGWSGLLGAVGWGLYVVHLRRVPSTGQSARSALLAATAALPIVASLLYHAQAGPGAHDRTPLWVGMAALGLFTLDWRHRVRATVPVARRDVIEHLAEAVILTDASGSVLDMNPAAEALTNATLDRVRGRDLAEVAVERAVGRLEVDGGEFGEAVQRLLRDGGRFAARSENGRGGVFEVRVAAVRSERGEASGLYLILREITQQTRFEALMRQSQRLETVAGLAAGIAHEVNNPLAYVRSNLSYVQRTLDEFSLETGANRGGAAPERGAVSDSNRANRTDKAAWDELRLVIEEGIEGVDRIGRIIDRVRRFSRIGSEELAPASVNDIVRDAVRVAQLGRFGSVELELSLPDGVPWIEASAEALAQAVTNLVVNAAQAVSERGGSVQVATRSVDDQIEIRVSDDGPGIPSAVRDRIFDPFFTTKKPGEGTGLGLAVAFGIAREHGGVLLYDPPQGGGSVFLMRLPAAPEPRPA